MRIDGSVARKLDFGGFSTRVTSTGLRGRTGLRLAAGAGRPAGPEKYRLFEHRRRQAQITARRLLASIDAELPEGRP